MPRRRGVVLLEVMVALAILAIAGGALLSVTSESAAAVRRAENADRTARAADDFLAVVSLWSATDLDRRLGARRQGPWVLSIGREEKGLYAVSLLDPDSPRPVLSTVLFRMEATR